MIDENEIETLTRCFPADAGVTPAHVGPAAAASGRTRDWIGAVCDPIYAHG